MLEEMDLSDYPEQKQVRTASSTLPAELGPFVRGAVMTVTGYALGRGWIDGETQQALISLAGVAAPIIWGWLAARKNKKTIVGVAKGETTVSLKGGQ